MNIASLVICKGSPTAQSVIQTAKTRVFWILPIVACNMGTAFSLHFPCKKAWPFSWIAILHVCKPMRMRLNIPFPGYAILTDEVRRIGLIHPRCVLKIMLTRGVGGRGYRRPEQSNGTRILSAHPKPNYPKSIRESGVQARFCDIRLGLNPHLAGIKHLNRLEQVLARAEWQDEDIQRGLDAGP